MNNSTMPVVGVATLIFKQDKVLLGRRKKTPGYDTWQFPGGLMQAEETVFDCARREVLEETGMQIRDLAYGPYTNNIFSHEAMHSVTLYVAAVTDDEPYNVEPALARNWQWFNPSALPGPLFLPIEELLRHHQHWFDLITKAR